MSEPDSLYQLSSSALIQNFVKLRHGLYLCPENIIFDVIFKVFQLKKNRPAVIRIIAFPYIFKIIEKW